MAANIQMIFYRKEGTADILVRILHNEHEMYLPLASARPPYYKWDDLRAFYHRRIAEAKATAAEPPSAGALQAPRDYDRETDGPSTVPGPDRYVPNRNG